MVIADGALVVVVLAALVFWAITILSRAGSRGGRDTRAVQGTWRAGHYEKNGSTRVVVHRVTDAGRVVDEHVVATIRADDADYDRRFLEAMATARERVAMFRSEDG